MVFECRCIRCLSVRRATGMLSRMKESYRKGAANHPDLEFCGACREA